MTRSSLEATAAGGAMAEAGAAEGIEEAEELEAGDTVVVVAAIAQAAGAPIAAAVLHVPAADLVMEATEAAAVPVREVAPGAVVQTVQTTGVAAIGPATRAARIGLAIPEARIVQGQVAVAAIDPAMRETAPVEEPVAATVRERAVVAIALEPAATDPELAGETGRELVAETAPALAAAIVPAAETVQGSAVDIVRDMAARIDPAMAEPIGRTMAGRIARAMAAIALDTVEATPVVPTSLTSM